MKNNQQINIANHKQLKTEIDKIEQYIEYFNSSEKNEKSIFNINIKEDFNFDETLDNIKKLLENIGLKQKENIFTDDIDREIGFLNYNLDNFLAFEKLKELPALRVSEIEKSQESHKFKIKNQILDSKKEVGSENGKKIFDPLEKAKIFNLQNELQNIELIELKQSPKNIKESQELIPNDSTTKLNLVIAEVNQLIIEKKNKFSSDTESKLIRISENQNKDLLNETYQFDPEDAQKVGLGNIETAFLGELKKKYPEIEIHSKENRNLLLYKDNKFFSEQINLESKEQLDSIKEAMSNYKSLGIVKDLSKNININNNEVVLGISNPLNDVNRKVANLANDLKITAENAISSISNIINKNIGEKVFKFFSPSKIGIKNPNQYIKKGFYNILSNEGQNAINQDSRIEQFEIKKPELIKDLLEKDETIWPFAMGLYKAFLEKYKSPENNKKITLPTNPESEDASEYDNNKEAIIDFLANIFPDFGKKICSNFINNNHNKVNFNSFQNKFARYAPSCTLGIVAAGAAFSVSVPWTIIGALAGTVAYVASDDAKALFDRFFSRLYTKMNYGIKKLTNSKDGEQSIFDTSPVANNSFSVSNPNNEVGEQNNEQEKQIEAYLDSYFINKKSFNSQSTVETNAIRSPNTNIKNQNYELVNNTKLEGNQFGLSL